jgi:hypothetical protein
MADFVSEAFAAGPLRRPHRRADVELHGVDQTVPSYEGRIFVNNPEADETTKRSRDSGFLGSFHVFGKAGCWGEEGHCEEQPPRRKFDRRRGPTLRAKIRVTLDAEQLQQIASREEELTISVVAAVPSRDDYRQLAGEGVLRFKRLSLITYD